MVKNNVASAVVLCLILVPTSMPTSECSTIRAPVAREEDVKFIKCQVCEKLASQLYHQVQNRRAQISPEKIPKDEMIQIAQNLCNLEKEEAVWIHKIDIVEQGDKLKLVDQHTEGICNSECKTLQKACEEVMVAPEIVPRYLNKPNPKPEGMVSFLCKNLTEACKFEPPPVPKDRTPGEAFVPIPSEEADVDRSATLSMEGTPGAPYTNMYMTDESMNMKNSGEEDEAKDTPSPSKSGVWKLMKSIGKKVERCRKSLTHSKKMLYRRLREKGENSKSEL